MTRWTKSPLMGFDTETTGTDVREDRIVTAALVFSTGPGAEFETVSTWLINPGVHIPDAAAAVHGISNEYVQANGVEPAGALEEIADLLSETLQGNVPIVAFNASFDLQILEHELRRHGLPTLGDRIGKPVSPIIDPLVLDRAADKWRKGKRKLVDLCQVYEVEQDGELHAADVDVSATLAVLRGIAGKHPKVAEMLLDDLHQWQIRSHRDWAENFNEWLSRKGKTPDVNVVWPL